MEATATTKRVAASSTSPSSRENMVKLERRNIAVIITTKRERRDTKIKMTTLTNTRKLLVIRMVITKKTDTRPNINMEKKENGVHSFTKKVNTVKDTAPKENTIFTKRTNMKRNRNSTTKATKAESTRNTVNTSMKTITIRVATTRADTTKEANTKSTTVNKKSSKRADMRVKAMATKRPSGARCTTITNRRKARNPNSKVERNGSTKMGLVMVGATTTREPTSNKSKLSPRTEKPRPAITANRKRKTAKVPTTTSSKSLARRNPRKAFKATTMVTWCKLQSFINKSSRSTIMVEAILIMDREKIMWMLVQVIIILSMMLIKYKTLVFRRQELVTPKQKTAKTITDISSKQRQGPSRPNSNLPMTKKTVMAPTPTPITVTFTLSLSRIPHTFTKTGKSAREAPQVQRLQNMSLRWPNQRIPRTSPTRKVRSLHPTVIFSLLVAMGIYTAC